MTLPVDPAPRTDAPAPGRLEVITGPMFSGKSEELIRRLRRAGIARQRVVCFKPDLDIRYAPRSISSHSALRYEAEVVAGVAQLRAKLDASEPIDVVGIDEVQFFAPEIVSLVLREVARGRRMLLAGLDMTFAGRPFGPMPALMALADEVLKLSAVCTVCGQPAVHSQRLAHSQELVMVGSTGMYEARCRRHFEPFAEEGDS